MKTLANKQVSVILHLLEQHYSGAKTALDFRTPMEMLVSTILSAQCTDARVNKVTPAVFKRYPDAQDYAEADQKELENLVRSTGFFKNKAKNIIGAAKMITRDFNGEVPKTIEEMTRLPGVGRKTASVVLFNAWGVIEGIVVDTHVGRLARRLGFSASKNAIKVEQDLMKIVPREDWANIAYWLIDHGRAICKSIKPNCESCLLNKVCPSAFCFDKKGKWIGVK